MAEAGWHFPGAVAHPQDTWMCQKPFSLLGKSPFYCYPFQINFIPSSILDKSECYSSSLDNARTDVSVSRRKICY